MKSEDNLWLSMSFMSKVDIDSLPGGRLRKFLDHELVQFHSVNESSHSVLSDVSDDFP